MYIANELSTCYSIPKEQPLAQLFLAHLFSLQAPQSELISRIKAASSHFSPYFFLRRTFMGGKKIFKQAFAVLLATTILFTQQSITGYGLSEVQAEDGSWVATSYVTNGDFEGGTTDGWTIDSTATAEVLTNQWASDTSNHFLNIYAASAGTGTSVSLSQTVSLPAGKYYVTLKNAGDAMNSVLSLGINGTTTSLTKLAGWDTWGTTTSEQFELSAATSLDLTISGTITKDGYYEKLDNIVIYKWQDAPQYTYDDLTQLIASVPSDYTDMGFTSDSTAALTTALSAANTCTSETDSASIASAYEALTAALDGLVFDGTVFVQKVSDYDTDSIRGVDISSYLSLMDAFDEVNSTITDDSKKVGFRDWNGNLLDKQGFFDLLASSGVNYVRLRVWNNPYSSTDAAKGYGGGNNDLAKAVEMGQYATNAGMKTLIDFHFSDFWADPSKQKAPKAWSSYTVSEKATAISDYVTSSLNTLKDANVAVGMVQIGNETTAGFCGETSWTNMDILFDAGCDAIHAFNTANGTDILAALHFTNPEKSGKYTTIAASLANYDGDGDGTKEGVSYDVFASSYYPYWHGTISNLTSVLKTIATTYGKYVMVAETSWATTYEDGDGHENTINDSGDLGSDASYNVTVQGQADEVRDVIAAVNDVNVTLANGDKAGLGMFYWEPAWIPVQYAYNEDGTVNSDTLASNKALWEKYGCGWASSYAGEYDAADAGVWYGGSAVDNQAMFDFSGNPLASLNVYKYVAYGATTALSIDSYSCDPVSIEVGTAVTGSLLPSTVSVSYNDSSTAALAVTWNTEDISKVAAAALTNSGIGKYTVNGTVTLSDSSTYPVACTVSVIAKNILTDYSFENASSAWTITGTGGAITKDDPKTGSKAVHLYSASAFSFTLSQTVTAEDAGTYKGYLYIQGGAGTGSNTGERIYLSATTSDGTEYTSDDVTLNGWKSWIQPTVSDIAVEAGDTITFTLHVTAAAGSWGTIDDACLYLDKAATTTEPTTATSITLDKSSLTMAYGDTSALVCATDQDTSTGLPSFTSSNTKVATVDSNGKITAVGTGSATVTAATTDGSELTANCTVTVTAKDISKAAGLNVSLSKTSYVYDKTAKVPVVTVTLNSKPLVSGTDYTVSYSNNTSVGTATVTVNGKGNYTGKIAKSYTITKASSKINVKYSSYTKTYGSKAFGLGASVNSDGKLSYSSSSKKVVTVNSSGKVTIVGYGTATITITSAATKNYSAASTKVKITVTPKTSKISAVKSSKAGKATVSWSKDKTVSGYIISYSTSKNFKNAKTVTVTSAKTTSKELSKLSKGKTYYVKICAYKTVSGKKILGSYSDVKKVTVKK